jgi:hypothetical protein
MNKRLRNILSSIQRQQDGSDLHKVGPGSDDVQYVHDFE